MDTFYFKGTRGTPELPLSASAKTRYGFAEDILGAQSTLQIEAFAVAQRLAQTINEVRDARQFPESAVRAGELYAAALVQEMLRLIVADYLTSRPDALARATTQLESELGRSELDKTLAQYLGLFPPKIVLSGEVTPDVYLTGKQAGVSNRQVALESLVLLYLANLNPALGRFRDLFDDTPLAETRYPEVIAGLEAFFAGEPDTGTGQKLFDLLRAPIDGAPTSLEGQLGGLREQLSTLGLSFGGVDALFRDALRTGDTLREEQKVSFGGGPGPVEIIDPAAASQARRGSGAAGFVPDEYEAFSQDSSWMPRVVMLAKSTFVWLGQLSKQYGRDINRLDEIPDEELDELARRGFTGLWLIGLWERSKASKTIKNLRGNPDAVASAYSLYDYVIADDLGGFEAFENLKARAWGRGIRVASDMVPNHVGVDGRWVVEHPEWFLQLDESPYPSYTFDGPDLSQDERVGIFLEDHYYDSSDAAVVFKRQDKETGDVKYIYHGNDGTTIPWNDTAQVDYLNAEAREAVIQTILHVARLSPIIRFDAAMVLAKQHIQRLWYPEPGSGGAIASRAQYGSMSTEDFDRAIPQEFWREVVDRVAEEVPDTLLLAEAFWMMEGYFVRTLGMHRVYNSAFMHMFKNEDNAQYRRSIKNVLEFEPEILKRFVNFMSNPDEETAVAQFGKDDKYFGVAVMMATMPGLPMFGHGQVEGYAEKYGMEYRRAKLDETPDTWLIDRHHREVFPLLHRRYQFAEVENFQLYDMHTGHGVDEDVYAYSNLVDGQASLVTFNNNFGHASGWIREATPQAGKTQRTLLQGLGLKAGERDFVRFREQVSGLWFVRRSRDLEGGLALSLDAYKYQVFVDFDEVTDTDGHFERLHDALGGRGVYDLGAELSGSQLGPVHQAFSQVLSADVIRTLRSERGEQQLRALESDLPSRLTELVRVAGGQVDKVSLTDAETGSEARADTSPSTNTDDAQTDATKVAETASPATTAETTFASQLARLIALPSLEFAPDSAHRKPIEEELSAKLTDEGSGTLYAALVLETLAGAGVDVESLQLEGLIYETFTGAGLPDAERARLLVQLLRRYGPAYPEGAEALLRRLKTDDEAKRFVRYDAETDAFSESGYREATVRPLAYILLSAGEGELGLLAATMNELSRAEVQAEGKWAALAVQRSETAEKVSKPKAGTEVGTSEQPATDPVQAKDDEVTPAEVAEPVSAGSKTDSESKSTATRTADAKTTASKSTATKPAAKKTTAKKTTGSRTKSKPSRSKRKKTTKKS